MAANDQWDPGRYAAKAGFVPELGRPVVDLLAPQPGERILDLGCGDGALTAELVDAGVEVVGVDASARMLGAAHGRGLAVARVDGHRLALRAGSFDAVFSNAALHWMLRPAEVAKGVHDVLRPGGRFVAEFGGHGCVAAITVALMATLEARGINARDRWPWYFPTVDEYAEVLEKADFTIDSIVLIPRPTALPGPMEDWLETFAAAFLMDLPESERAAVRSEVAERLRPVLCDSRHRWTADYVRLRFSATR